MSAGDDDDSRDSDAPVSSGEIDVTGWSATDGDAAQKKRNKRKRITLDVFGPPLELPQSRRHDAIPPAPADEGRSTAEYMLPDMRGLPQPQPRAPSPSSELAKIEDAWSRTRDIPEAVPPRPRTETPPPFAPAESNPGTISGANDALALVSRRSRPPGSSVLDLSSEMLDRFALGDFSGALLAAELVLGKDPGHAEAQRCAASCRDRLSDMYLSRLGGAHQIPTVAVAGSEVRWLGLDHRAGFLLSRVDGRSSVEELVDLSGMPRHEALKLLVELVGAGALSLKGR